MTEDARARFQRFTRRAAGLFRVVSGVLLAAVLLFLLVEALGSLVLDLRVSARIRDWRSIPYYDSQPWADALWEESRVIFEDNPVEYHPFLIWRRTPLAGETIHVNEHGIRNTTGAECVDGDYRVFAFGGSTMWGFGSPDWLTIPSLVQAGLAENRADPVCVVNFAEPAFVSTQAVIQLLLELQAGSVPDAVLFLDGVNDVVGAYQNGEPGGHHNQDRIQDLLNRSDSPISLALGSTHTAALWRLFTTRAPQPDTLNDPALAAGVAEAYLHNLSLVSDLADRYGFEAHFFLQPVLSEGEKVLTPAERQLLEESDPALVSLMGDIYHHIEMQAPDTERLTSLVSVFDGTGEQVWIDLFHLTGHGNQIVADAILAEMQR